MAFLCGFFYLLGAWQHGGMRNKRPTMSITTAVVGPGGSAGPGTGTCLESSGTGNGPLDFAAHHGSDDADITMSSNSMLPDSTAYPACPANYSEHTPCEDLKRSLKFQRDRLIYRERHCPSQKERLKCRIPAPYGYKNPFKWPKSRDYAWYNNVPHKELTVEKAVQNWIRFEGDKFKFPGGGTMFPNGADAYIDDIGKLINLKDGSIRTAIDTGCGVRFPLSYLVPII